MHTQPKFKISDELRHVSSRCRTTFFVVAVMSETCPGGTQHHYHCRTFIRGDLSTELVRINEVEVRFATPDELDAETKSSFSAWMDTKTDAAIQGKNFDLAKSWRSLQKNMEELQMELKKTQEAM